MNAFELRRLIRWEILIPLGLLRSTTGHGHHESEWTLWGLASFVQWTNGAPCNHGPRRGWRIEVFGRCIIARSA